MRRSSQVQRSGNQLPGAAGNHRRSRRSLEFGYRDWSRRRGILAPLIPRRTPIAPAYRERATGLLVTAPRHPSPTASRQRRWPRDVLPSQARLAARRRRSPPRAGQVFRPCGCRPVCRADSGLRERMSDRHPGRRTRQGRNLRCKCRIFAWTTTIHWLKTRRLKTARRGAPAGVRTKSKPGHFVL